MEHHERTAWLWLLGLVVFGLGIGWLIELRGPHFVVALSCLPTAGWFALGAYGDIQKGDRPFNIVMTILMLLGSWYYFTR